MSKKLSEIKKSIDKRLAELRDKRQAIVYSYRKKLVNKKIEQIKDKLSEN